MPGTAPCSIFLYPAKVSRHLPRRLATPPTMLQDLSGTAPGRLGQRYRPLGARGNQTHLVPGAMARELVGGLGAMAHQRPVAA
jgi:hypothetical protein